MLHGQVLPVRRYAEISSSPSIVHIELSTKAALRMVKTNEPEPSAKAPTKDRESLKGEGWGADQRNIRHDYASYVDDEHWQDFAREHVSGWGDTSLSSVRGTLAKSRGGSTHLRFSERDMVAISWNNFGGWGAAMPGFSKDETAILALIHANRIAVWTQNFEEYQKCFVHADYTTRWNASHVTGILVREGWEEISSTVRKLFSDYLADADPEFGRAQAYDTEVLDLKIRIIGDMAWATFRQNYPAASPPSATSPARAWHRAGSSPSHEVRVFERHGGQWRIAFLGFLDADSALSGSAVVRLSPEGLIEWQSESAAALLLQDDDLVVRNGRLRVRDARTDARLQAAIKWAAALSAPLIPGRGSLPLVMQASDGLPAKVWWVIADGGRVYFSLSHTTEDEHRLEAAAIVYGLSPLQKRVAAQIVAGRQLSEIAEALHVTSNTARTHLDRIFDKVGVRSQAALVRALLSVASPV